MHLKIMTSAVSRRPFTSEARFRSSACVCACVIAVSKGALGQVSLHVHLFSPVSIMPPMRRTQFYLKILHLSEGQTGNVQRKFAV